MSIDTIWPAPTTPKLFTSSPAAIAAVVANDRGALNFGRVTNCLDTRFLTTMTLRMKSFLTELVICTIFY